MNIAEQIRAFELQKKNACDRQEALMQLSATEGRSLEAEEKTEFDALTAEVKECEEHIGRWKLLEARDGQTAEPVNKNKNVNGKGPTIIVRGKVDEDEKFKGQNFTRRAIARALSSIDPDRRSPYEIAQERWGKSAPQLCEVIKAGVAGGSGISGAWGAELVQADTRYTGDFIELLYAMTVFDKLALFEVPANVAIKGQDGTATANWVGENKSIPVSTQDYSTINLGYMKVAAISVVSKEILKNSSPAAEQLVRNSLLNACAQKVDSTFLGAAAVSAGVSPAGILNGVSSLGSNGNDGAALRADIRELYAPFITAKYDTSNLVLVMHNALAKSISLMANALGQTEFPGINANGGQLLGDKVVTGHNVGATTIILLDPTNIWRIGDTGIEVSVSDQATLEQDSAPAGDSKTPTAGSATWMSMFGTDSVAFKVVRPINFQKRRATAAQFISDAQYGDPTSTTA